MTEISIADHGLVGDLQTAALISTDGSVDWFCCPRFDSPSVFGALLDPGSGHFRIRPAMSGYRARQMYLPDTAVLITRFLSEAGVGEVIDFMPPTGREATANHRLIRRLRCVRGEMGFAIDLPPRFDYGRAPHTLEPTEHGAVFDSGLLRLTLHPLREPDDPGGFSTSVAATATPTHSSNSPPATSAGSCWRRPPTGRRGRYPWRNVPPAACAPERPCQPVAGRPFAHRACAVRQVAAGILSTSVVVGSTSVVVGCRTQRPIW